MAKDEAPPRFLKPGDDPKVDELLARLRKDGEDGDPLYVNYRKRQHERARALPAEGAEDAALPIAPEAEVSPNMAAVAAERPHEPQPVELPVPQEPMTPASAADASSKGSRATPRWLLWGALAITAPVVALMIGFLWSRHQPTSAAVDTPAASARATTTIGPAPSARVADAPTAVTAIPGNAPVAVVTSSVPNEPAVPPPSASPLPRPAPKKVAPPDAGVSEPPPPRPKAEPTLPSELYQ